MPKRRPMESLRRLGRRIRSRRVHLGLARDVVARGADISVSQLVVYESGQGHPPAFTLHRIAVVLGTSTSALLGETAVDDAARIDEMMQIYAHPIVGAVVRDLCGMSKQDRQSLKIIAGAFAARHRNGSSVDTAHPNQTKSAG
jgi:transcriptional regulator with XRE-family HTH domain